MIHGQSFDSYISSCRKEQPVFRCRQCDRMFSDDTFSSLEKHSLPCPCGDPLDNLEKWYEWDHQELQYRDEMTTTLDAAVALLVDSGFWRCKECGYTAPEECWIQTGAGTEVFTECPECGQCEDYEILKLGNK